MSRGDLVNHPMVTGAGPQKNRWFAEPEYALTSAQMAVNKADWAALDGARNWDLAPRRPSWWRRLIRRLRGERTIARAVREYERKHRYVVGADPAAGPDDLVMGDACRVYAQRRADVRRIDQIRSGVCDYRASQASPGRRRRDIPLWAQICFPIAAGLAVGALLYLLRP